MSKELTDRQEAIFTFIKHFAIDKGYPPTIPEIQEKFEIKSPNGVNNHLKALIKKGFIRRDSSRARALDILGRNDGLPIIGNVAAGSPILAEENFQGYLNLKNLYSDHDSVFVLNVKGESMINAGIFDGDYVIVRVQQVVEAGEIGVAIIDGEATVKRIFCDGNIIRLVPENDNMEPIQIPMTDPSFRICGKVVAVVRKM